MFLLQSLPTVIGTAAIAPALLILWLVIAAGERPGPPARVWTAFLLGAASISLLGVVRKPLTSLFAVPEHPWLAQALHSILGVAAPEEIVKILVIVVVSTRRRPGADPMDSVVYGAAAGLGFAAYENLAYLVQHQEIWRSLAALRSVLTVPFHGALGIIAGAYLAIARSGTALGANRHHRDWSRISSRALILLAPVTLHAAFDFPLLMLQQNPDMASSTRLILGATSLLIGFGTIGLAVRLVWRVGRHHAPRTEVARERLSQSADVGPAGSGRRRRLCRPRLRADVDPPLVRQSRAQRGDGAGTDRPYVHPDRRSPVAGDQRDLCSRPQSHAHDSGGFFVGAGPRLSKAQSELRPIVNYGPIRTRSPPPLRFWDDKTKCMRYESAHDHHRHQQLLVF